MNESTKNENENREIEIIKSQLKYPSQYIS